MASVSRKSIVLNTDVKKGEELTLERALTRPGTGLYAKKNHCGRNCYMIYPRVICYLGGYLLMERQKCIIVAQEDNVGLFCPCWKKSTDYIRRYY